MLEKILKQANLAKLNRKIDDADRKLAEANGVAEGDKAGREAWSEAHGIGRLVQQTTDSLPSNLVGKLALFRQETGEEMWTAIANNPSLPELINTWFAEYGRVKMINLAQQIAVLLKNYDVTYDDAIEFIQGNMER